MCGHVGFIGYTKNREDVLEDMMKSIIHRGPDSDGKYIDDNIAMGFRRLSIIDIEQGSQPMFNEDNSLVLIFNGEIYNFKDIRTELTKKGHIFKTNTDSEILLHSYEEYGVDMLLKLRGMFSFIIWDNKIQQLFGARDFFGIKPMYYATMDDCFIFGSEIKSFLHHPKFEKSLNTTALENYLTFQYSPTNETFFKNVYKLPPAHYFIFKDNKIITKKYWSIEFKQDNSISKEEWIEKIDKAFKNSVDAHKISDVEVGSFLSSGVDSSYVACVADVDKTFTVGFGNKDYSEIDYAKELSSNINVENISKVITAEEYWSEFPKIQYHMDEPLADPAAVALYFVCNLASNHLKVVLSGEGADEIFGGYNIYKEPIEFTKYNKIPLFLRRIIGKIASIFPPKFGINFLVRRGKLLEERFIGNAYIFSEKERKNILKIKTNAPNYAEITKPFYDEVKEKDSITKMQYLDLNLWMVGDILLKADKMSMANSLELRVPFLDKEIMALACKIPTKFRVNTENTKFVMRKAAEKNLPKKVADKKKLGFPVPIRVWLKEDKYYNLVKKEFLSENSKLFFNQDIILSILDNHKNGKYDNSRKIWTIYTFLIWYNQFFK